MPRVAVRIFHLEPDEDTGELGHLVAQARLLVGEQLAVRFEAAGAGDVRLVAGPPDGRPFGARLREQAKGLDGGLVVLGSGSIPLAHDRHLEALVAVAARGGNAVLTNNRHSADVVAVGDARLLADVPDLAADNLLPRWLATTADVAVEELPDRERLALDVDSPLDLELLRRHPACPPGVPELAAAASPLLARAANVLDRLTDLVRDPGAELLVAGRLSAATLALLERATACRVRALVEERGLRASAPLPEAAALPRQRPAATTLGLLLDRGDASAIGAIVDRLADGAVIDSRVLLAHRLGADEAAWPTTEDRFASDLLLADRVGDPWLAALTRAAAAHGRPIALGGHTLVGPGIGLALDLGGAAE